MTDAAGRPLVFSDRVHTVTGCNRCVMCNYGPHTIYCNHPDANEKPIGENYELPYVDKAPDWCPLRKESITIRLDI